MVVRGGREEMAEAVIPDEEENMVDSRRSRSSRIVGALDGPWQGYLKIEISIHFRHQNGES